MGFGASASPGASTVSATQSPNGSTGNSGCSASCQKCVGVPNSGFWATDEQCAACLTGSNDEICQHPAACKCDDGNYGNGVATTQAPVMATNAPMVNTGS